MGACGGKIPIVCVSEVMVAVPIGSGAVCPELLAGVGAGLGVAGFRLLAVTFCSALKT